jgi:glycopeptide antibiotics resistance protein
VGAPGANQTKRSETAQAPAKGPNTIDLVPFWGQVRAIGAWQHGYVARGAFSELGLNVLLLVPFALALARVSTLPGAARVYAPNGAARLRWKRAD